MSLDTLIAASVPTIAVIGLWIERSIRQAKQHTENQTRLTAIETMVKPMWDWWTTNGKH